MSFGLPSASSATTLALLGALALPACAPAPAPRSVVPDAARTVVLINPFVVPEGKEAEAVAFWEEARDVLAAQPGFVSTRLHRALDPGATYGLVNVAEWESVEAFRAATQKMREELPAPGVAGLAFDPALYVVVRE
jgi:hypothetical protein